jgi:hypothetical protein
MKKLTLGFVFVLGLMCLITSVSAQTLYTVNIDDRGEEITATINGIPIDFLSDSHGEYVHFQIPLPSGEYTRSVDTSRDLLEPDTLAVSDRLLVDSAFQSTYLNVQFSSEDPVTIRQGGAIYTPRVEDGTFQFMAATSSLSTMSDYEFYVASDIADVPEPSSIILLSTGVFALAFYGGRRRGK